MHFISNITAFGISNSPVNPNVAFLRLVLLVWVGVLHCVSRQQAEYWGRERVDERMQIYSRCHTLCSMHTVAVAGTKVVSGG